MMFRFVIITYWDNISYVRWNKPRERRYVHDRRNVPSCIYFELIRRSIIHQINRCNLFYNSIT